MADVFRTKENSRSMTRSILGCGVAIAAGTPKVARMVKVADVEKERVGDRPVGAVIMAFQ